MMEGEKVATVEAVNGETVGNQFACHYRNMILIERAVRHAICFVVGKVAGENWHRLQAEMVSTRIIDVHGC